MISPMNRRAFVAGLGAVLAAAVASEAQQAERLRRIGVLMGYAESNSDAQAKVAAFQEGLQNLGWVEGRNITWRGC